MLKCFYILIWIAVFESCFCQRRTGLGNESVLGKKYLVYFVTSPYSETDDDTWLCAGAIVTPTQVLTAAACLVEVNRIYAIAGNKKYLNGRDIDKDKCANTWKKKVVKISVPNEYAASNAKLIEWMNVDIGVATVQEPYDFNDKSYITHCSYVPESIKINFDKNNEKENTRGIALGWGGKKAKSKDSIVDKIKPKLLQEATTTIIEKSFCANLKNGSKELVNTYLLCASGNGFLGESDETTSKSTVEKRPSLSTTTTKSVNESNEMSSRKSSLLETCQNDHGGPLITWIGKEEIILGVALNGICNPNFDCVGPRIYVSTAATAKIVKCLLETNSTRRKTCNNQIDDKRYQVKDIDIKWPKYVNNNASLSEQQSLLFRRQREEEESLIIRPTKNLNNFDDQEIPQDNRQEDTQYNPLENLEESQENPSKNRQRILQENRGQSSYNQQPNPSQVDQTRGIVNEEPNNRPRKPVVGYISQQQNMESQNQPERDAYNQPQIKSQNQPQMDSFNEAQMGSYNQPPLDPYYNQPPLDSIYNQRPMDSNYNQPPINSNYPTVTESYNQPQTGLYHQPLVNQNIQNPMNPYNQQDLPNQPQMERQRQINTDKSNNQQIPNTIPPQTEYMPSQEQSYNQPQIGSYNNQLKDLFKIPTFEKSLAEPAEPVTPESYNPLDILMAEEDDSFKPMEESFKPLPTELHKQRNDDQFIQQQLSNTKHNPHSQQHEQPNSALSAQNFELARNPTLNLPQGDSQGFEKKKSQLRAGPEAPEQPPPSKQETFDDLFSDLHDGGFEKPRDNKEAERTGVKNVNERQGYDKTQDVVSVRQQMPLEYPDYSLKSSRIV